MNQNGEMNMDPSMLNFLNSGAISPSSGGDNLPFSVGTPKGVQSLQSSSNNGMGMAANAPSHAGSGEENSAPTRGQVNQNHPQAQTQMRTSQPNTSAGHSKSTVSSQSSAR